MIYIILNALTIIFLLLWGAFFAATETAYTSLSRVSVRQMVRNREKNANLVMKIKDDIDTLISTALIGTNFVNTLNSSVATAFSIKMFGDRYVSSSTFVILFLILVFAEIVPKTYAVFRTEKMAQDSAPIIYFIQKAIWILVWIFSKLTKVIEILEGILFKTKRPLITEEELKTLLDVGENEGTIEQNEHKMLERIFEFSDLTLHNVMRHRSLVKYVSIDASLDDVMNMFEVSKYSRIPVYEGTPDNIVGYIHYKSILYAEKPVTESPDFIRICMQSPLFVPETLSAVDLLKKFKHEKINFAVVVNEYGSLAGIVTLDDILREVFGRMTDEHGHVETAPEKRVTVVNVNEFLVPGDMRLDEVKDVLNISLSSDNFDTLGGWLLEKFDELPAIGSIYKKDGIYFTVEDQSTRRIQTVRIRIKE